MKFQPAAILVAFLGLGLVAALHSGFDKSSGNLAREFSQFGDAYRNCFDPFQPVLAEVSGRSSSQFLMQNRFINALNDFVFRLNDNKDELYSHLKVSLQEAVAIHSQSATFDLALDPEYSGLIKFVSGINQAEMSPVLLTLFRQFIGFKNVFFFSISEIKANLQNLVVNTINMVDSVESLMSRTMIDRQTGNLVQLRPEKLTRVQFLLGFLTQLQEYDRKQAALIQHISKELLSMSESLKDYDDAIEALNFYYKQRYVRGISDEVIEGQLAEIQQEKAEMEQEMAEDDESSSEETSSSSSGSTKSSAKKDDESSSSKKSGGPTAAKKDDSSSSKKSAGHHANHKEDSSSSKKSGGHHADKKDESTSSKKSGGHHGGKKEDSSSSKKSTPAGHTKSKDHSSSSKKSAPAGAAEQGDHSSSSKSKAKAVDSGQDSGSSSKNKKHASPENESLESAVEDVRGSELGVDVAGEPALEGEAVARLEGNPKKHKKEKKRSKKDKKKKSAKAAGREGQPTMEDLMADLANSEEGDPDNSIKVCDKLMMNNYGIDGLSLAQEVDPSQLLSPCERIQTTCCDQESISKAFENFQNNQLDILLRTYKVADQILGSLLGNYQKYNKLAYYFIKNSQTSQTCLNLARKVIFMPISKDFATRFMANMHQAQEFSKRAKANFICWVCDYAFQKQVLEKAELPLSKEFCSSLMETHYSFLLSYSMQLTEYLNDVADLLQCNQNSGAFDAENPPRVQANPLVVDLLMKCSENKVYCTDFCEQFSFTSLKGPLEVNVDELKDYYDWIESKMSTLGTPLDDDIEKGLTGFFSKSYKIEKSSSFEKRSISSLAIRFTQDGDTLQSLNPEADGKFIIEVLERGDAEVEDE